MALERVIKIKIDSSGAKRDVNSLDRSMKGLGASADNTNKSFGSLKATVIAVATALQARVIIGYSEAWKRVNNQLLATIPSTQTLASAQSDVVRIAKDARAPLEGVAKLYGGISSAANELGVSQDEVARFTELASKSIAVQSSSAGEAAGALLQLRQAIGGAVIQAQEFNSLIDGARPLLEAVANGSDRFGGSVNKLRNEVRKGTVTSKEFFEAALKGANIIDKRFNATIKTLAQSFQEAENNAIAFIGTSDQITSTIGEAGQAIVFLSENLDTISDILLVAAVVGISKLSASLIINTTETIKNTIAKQAAAREALALAKSDNILALSALEVAKTEQAAALGMFRSAEGATKATIANSFLIKSNKILASANAKVVASQAAVTSAMRVSSTAANGLKGAMAFLGGPLGVALIAASAIAVFATSADDARTPTEKLADEVTNLSKKFSEFNKGQLTAQLGNAIAKVETLRKKISEVESKPLQGSKLLGGSEIALDKLNSQFEEAIKLRDALFEAGITKRLEGATEQSGLTATAKPVKQEDPFINNERFKTDSLRAELNERQEIQRAFNSLALAESLNVADQERAITEFNRQADLAALETQKTQSALDFEQRKEAILLNDKLTSEARLILGLELQQQELDQKAIFEIEKTDIERIAAEERKLITQDELDFRTKANEAAQQIIVDSNSRSVLSVLGFLQQFSSKSKVLAKALVVLRAAEGVSSAIINSQVAATRALAELGPIAGPPAAAKMVAFGRLSAGIIAANAVIKLGGGGGGGGSISLNSGAQGSTTTPAARQEPIQQSNVVEIRGLSEIAAELANLDPREVLPVGFIQRIVDGLDEFQRVSGEGG